jgi:hypothetical protein
MELKLFEFLRQKMDQWQVLVRAVMKFRVRQERRISRLFMFFCSHRVHVFVLRKIYKKKNKDLRETIIEGKFSVKINYEHPCVNSCKYC